MQTSCFAGTNGRFATRTAYTLTSSQAQAENRTVDDLLDEAARQLLEQRQDIDGLRSLISENRAQAIKEGWTERSVASVVKKHRQEKSRR